MSFHESEAAMPLSKSLPGTCTHSRMISYCVSVAEQKAGKVSCVECGSVIPDPHSQREANGA